MAKATHAGRNRLAALLGAMAIVGAGCTGAVSSTQPSDAAPSAKASVGASPSGNNEPVELSFAIREYFKAEAEQIITAYEAANPNVSIELRLHPNDQAGYRQQLLTSKLADDLPNVIAVWDAITEEFADAEITTDMSPLLEGDGALAFAPKFLEAYRVISGSHQGEIHGFPQGADAIVLFYNKTHFDEAGLAYPDDSWTYEDMLDAARRLTKKDGDATTRWGLTTNYRWSALWHPMTISFGGNVPADDGSAGLDSEAALSAFHLLIDPVKEGIFVPPDVQQTLGGEETAFLNGSASMYLSVRALVPGIRSTLTDDWDVAQFPTVNGQRNVGSGSVGIATTTSVEDRDATEAFVRWYFSDDGAMKILASSYAVVPPIVELYDSPIWRDLPAPPANNDAFVQAIENGVISPEIPLAVRGGFDDIIAQAYEKVLVAGETIEDAFRVADDEATALLRGGG